MVIDGTGVSRMLDVNLTWNANALFPTTTSDGAASVIAAIQEQLGLRLVSLMTPINVIVVDRAEVPVRN